MRDARPPFHADPPGRRVEPEIKLPEITEAERLTLRPGDALAIRVGRKIRADEAQFLKERVQALLGKRVPVLILEPDMSVEVIESPGEPSGAAG